MPNSTLKKLAPLALTSTLSGCAANMDAIDANMSNIRSNMRQDIYKTMCVDGPGFTPAKPFCHNYDGEVGASIVKEIAKGQLVAGTFCIESNDAHDQEIENSSSFRGKLGLKLHKEFFRTYCPPETCRGFIFYNEAFQDTIQTPKYVKDGEMGFFVPCDTEECATRHMEIDRYFVHRVDMVNETPEGVKYDRIDPFMEGRVVGNLASKGTQISTYMGLYRQGFGYACQQFYFKKYDTCPVGQVMTGNFPSRDYPAGERFNVSCQATINVL